MRKAISIRQLFYAVWLLLSLVQAAGTELFDDEAYYWVYAKFMDWGYFDHPPMIALMIKLGTFVFAGELGVRLLVVLMGTGSIYLIEKLTQPKDQKLFYALVLNMAVLQIGGIIAVPDIPLLFFTALFFLAYRNYTTKNSWMSAIYLAIIIALLLYSKYHGILLVLATVGSNWKLLKQPLTWLVIAAAIALFMPHVLWQLQHGLPSLNYHLFERLSPPYSISFTTDYVFGQLLIAGPLVGGLVIWGALKQKPSDQTQRAMKWSLVFVYLLFLISSFRSRTEANWTIPLLVPLLVLSYHYIELSKVLTKWVYRLLPVSLLLVLVVRLFMIIDEPFINNLPKDEFHNNKAWAMGIKEKAGGLPVVFTNSYQRASKYWFYTGDTSFSLNTYLYRRSNYNFWPIEASLQNRKLLVVGSLGTAALPDTLNVGNKKLSIGFDEYFQSFSQIILHQPTSKITIKENTIEAVLHATAPSQKVLDNAIVHQPEIVLVVYRNNKEKPIVIPTGKRLSTKTDERLQVKLPQLKEKKYQARWGLQGSYTEATINSSVFTLLNDPH